MTRPPPRSTLFPTRRSSDLPWPATLEQEGFLTPLTDKPLPVFKEPKTVWKVDPSSMSTQYRSEEHTSELQSLTNLVCRLLLEKKKTNNITKKKITPNTANTD